MNKADTVQNDLEIFTAEQLDALQALADLLDETGEKLREIALDAAERLPEGHMDYPRLRNRLERLGKKLSPAHRHVLELLRLHDRTDGYVINLIVDENREPVSEEQPREGCEHAT